MPNKHPHIDPLLWWSFTASMHVPCSMSTYNRTCVSLDHLWCTPKSRPSKYVFILASLSMQAVTYGPMSHIRAHNWFSKYEKYINYKIITVRTHMSYSIKNYIHYNNLQPQARTINHWKALAITEDLLSIFDICKNKVSPTNQLS